MTASTAAAAKKILPSKKVNAGVSSMEERGETELYPTPEALTYALLDSGEGLPQVVWEPACALGHMVRPLVARGHTVFTSDKTSYGWPGQLEVKDFFDFQRPPSMAFKSGVATCIVTNPPFSLSDQFVRHGLTLCRKVIILNRLAFVEGKGRSDIIDGHLSRVYPIVERPPMMHRWKPNAQGIWVEWDGKKAPSAMPMCWYVFEREKTGPGFFALRVSWRKAMARVAEATKNEANLLTCPPDIIGG